MITFAALLPGAPVLGGCATIGIHDTESLFAPSFQRSAIVGFVAGFGTTFAAIPDLLKMIQRRSSQGINPTMASIMAVFQIAWIYYGPADHVASRDRLERRRRGDQFVDRVGLQTLLPEGTGRGWRALAAPATFPAPAQMR